MYSKSYSRYKNKNSLINKIDPFIKLLSFIIIITTIFIAQSIEMLLVVSSFIFIISLFAKVNWKLYFKLIFLLIPFFIFTTLIYWIFFPIIEALIYVAQMVLRIYTVLLLATTLTSATTELEMAQSFELLIRPLRLIKIPTYEISMILTLSLRFIPLILDDFKLVMIGQTGRGINSINGNIKEKISSMLNSITPVLMLSFKRSNDVSLVMKLRDYKIGEKRTRYIKNKFRFLEFLSLVLTLSLLIVIILIRINIINGNWF